MTLGHGHAMIVTKGWTGVREQGGYRNFPCIQNNCFEEH